MDHFALSPAEEAEQCRRMAHAYLGCPEAPFLLSIARAFDDIAFGRIPARRSMRPSLDYQAG